MATDIPSDQPEEMLSFSLLSHQPTHLAPRLGRLCRVGRKPILTPGYLPITSRGVLPHVSHDNIKEHMSIGSLYVALEDFIERSSLKETPPIYTTPAGKSESALRRFLSFDDEYLLFLGPRRLPPVATANSNSVNSVTILTSVGYQQLEVEQYQNSIKSLKPDIAIGLADVLDRQPGVKRREKMVDRTHAWTQLAIDVLFKPADIGNRLAGTSFFAPILPLERERQTIYLRDLEEEMADAVSGFAIWDPSTIELVPQTLWHLPRLSLGEPNTPQEVLRGVSLGLDLSAIPFIGTASDAGLALDFVFPQWAAQGDENKSSPSPLAVDMLLPVHSSDTSPLVSDCQCYTCKTYHRAYLRHLLNAKEMLAWTLLQIHNHAIMDRFFVDVRTSIERGTFEEDVKSFERTYMSEFPEPSGQGPRMRGYQFKTGPGEKRNPKVFGRLDGVAEKLLESQSSIVTPDAGAEELEERGFAEKI
ncbi:queuine tRNA-ribosyltransferase [Nannizzia gypsea CBS 118893]|uniref:Queuine tRNA-ribosyltransferase accessory subunit 2 n=1 Tax=Arthroderma gypseum (strain ATCC MYA-4604 / CBS 118893) TaxID=535722 RepID=E4URU9_ARTGP|nr:queuine tRNA-ribosyltransferase [Nannizzia gypsea CBS 118893]EFR01221.1 queuine tRNA-ribosyltransferase [Nannizzia gypsea CBS 118893]